MRESRPKDSLRAADICEDDAGLAARALHKKARSLQGEPRTKGKEFAVQCEPRAKGKELAPRASKKQGACRASSRKQPIENNPKTTNKGSHCEPFFCGILSAYMPPFR